MKPGNSLYAPETIGSIMSANIPACHENDTAASVLQLLAEKEWDSVRYIYVLDKEGKLSGLIDIAKSLHSAPTVHAKDLMQPAEHYLHPEVDQEEAVFIAVKEDVVAIPVVDHDHKLLGAVSARSIIDIMHQEHIEDALLITGIRSNKSISSIAKLATERTSLIVRTRAPWLVAGLAVGLGLGLISSFFEKSLEQSIALAYFIPVVAYIADSVGTQSEAITVRALATLKINYTAYLLKELLVGLVLGAIMGVLGGVGAMLISHSVHIGLVVSISLFVASALAATLAALIPMAFKARGKDPALGSGPLATALQDVLSVIIYFVCAVLLIGG